MKFILILATSILLNSNTINHPVHITVTNIDYNAKSKSFNISVKLFFDDLEKIINAKYITTLNIGKENENSHCDKFIIKYFMERLIFDFNGIHVSPTRMKFKKKIVKKEEKVVWIYYKIKSRKVPETVKITNKLMTDLYRDQKNLLIFTSGSFQAAETFTKTSDSFLFKIK